MALRLSFLSFVPLGVAFAQTPDSLERAAKQILETNCLACHGAAQMSGLDLRQRETALKGGKRGPAVIPGKAGESLLFRAVAHQGELPMPPGKSALSAENVQLLRAWIDAGAQWESSAPSAQASWWAFRKPERPPVPAIKSGSPIDAFILAKLEQKGLHPAPPADQRTLIRRAFFDLHGLPPTPEEIDQFVKDDSPNAYEELIDRLLASPRYGERWGRHWLDVVRYADTGGYETDVYFMNAWRYRDYVINSLNEDKPYNEFVQEQIAADELWPDNLDLNGSYDLPKSKQINLAKRIGTGLYTVGPMAVEYTFFGDQYRAEWQAEAVETTGSAFLGLTLGCARCHDHKFDPISQRDYYRLCAMFAGSEDREIPIVSQMGIYEYTRFVTKLVIADQLKARLLKLEAASGKRAGSFTAAQKDERETLLRQIGEAYAKAPVPYAKANVLVHSEYVPETHVLMRGEFKQKGEQVSPGFPAVLNEGPPIEEPARRKALALWLTSPDQPLLARVMVNRIWQGHFGRGLVGTPNDFGRQGELPTHPELLDWLALEFMQRGWSLKATHRLIMLSNTYRMSSRNAPENAKVDPENRYLWRMNRRRLEAEELRDSVLAVSGALNLKMGGPAIAIPLTEEEKGGMRDPTQWPVASDPAEHRRRSIYLYVKRSFRLPMFETFDLPDATASCARRETSTVAPQALALMNSEFITSQAARLAARLRKQHGESSEKWVDAGWQLAFGRSPAAEEMQKALAFASKHGLDRLCLVWLNMSEFLYVD